MKSSTWWIIGGIVSLIGGVFALLNPFPASLAVNFLAGWAFCLMGIMAIVAIFQAGNSTGYRVMMGIFGAAALFLGISLIANPLAGMVTLTILTGSLILVSGIARIITAFQMRGTDWFWLMLISGLISLLLAFLIFADFPESAATILGIFLGIELIFSGMSMFSMASFSRELEKTASA